MMKSRTPTKPIYAPIIHAAAAAPIPVEEPFDRLTRKDFWNDPERWDGIDDPRKTMIWNVRRPDVIDVREEQGVLCNARGDIIGFGTMSQLQAMQNSHNPLLSALSQRRGLIPPMGYGGSLFGGLLGY